MILYYLVNTLHILFCLFLILVVLLQQGKGQDLASAFGGGGTQTAFGPRGSATVLSRATALAAALFMVTSLALSIIQPSGGSLLDEVPAAPAAEAAPVSDAPDPGAATQPAAEKAPAEGTPVDEGASESDEAEAADPGDGAS